MTPKEIEECLLKDHHFSKRYPSLSFSVDSENGWYEIMKPIDGHPRESYDFGIAVNEDCNIDMYVSGMSCVVGCCGENIYSGQFDSNIVKETIENKLISAKKHLDSEDE